MEKRKHYLDNIRWITLCFVIIYHIFYIFNSSGVVSNIGVTGIKELDSICVFIYPWIMCLLFVVSGVSTNYSLKSKTNKEFIKDRAKRILVPSLIGIFVYGWISGWTTNYYGDIFAGNGSMIPVPIKYIIFSLIGIGPLWYAHVLFIASLLIVLVRKIDKNKKLDILFSKINLPLLFSLVLLVWGSSFILNTPVVTVYRFGIYGFCFFVGYFCFSNDEVMDRISRLWIFFDIIAIGLGIAYTVLYFGENYAVEPVINNVLACTFCWFAILAILSTMKKYGDNANTFSKWMTKKSWGLYVFHYLPLSVAAYVLINFAPNMPTLLIYILVTISAFAGAFALYEIISRIPVIRFCILGIKEKKHV